MTSVFPSLLSWSELAPFLLRLTLGAVIIYSGYSALRSKNENPTEKLIGIVEILASILLVIGLWTQLAALVVAIDLVVRLAFKVKNREFLTNGVNYYLILLIIALSLLVSGAGLLAFDYKL